MRHAPLSRIAAFLFTLVFLSIGVGPAAAQKANFELAYRFTTQNMDKMVGSLRVNPHWIEDEDRFWYEYEAGEGNDWFVVDAAHRRKQHLFDKEDMAARLAVIFHKPFNSKDLPLKDFDYDTDRGVFTFNVDSVKFTYQLGDGNLVEGDSLEKEERMRWATYSPDSTWIAFARQHNLYLMRADDPDSTEIQLTTDGERWYSYQADEGDTTSTKRLRSIARWFDDEKKLWAKREDDREVKPLWVVNTLGKRPELETYKYAMPGDEHVPQDEVWVFDVDTKEGVKLQTDRWKDQALGGPFFPAGGFYTTDKSDYLYILRRDRTWKKVDVLKANTSTGAVQVLWSEESDPYFNVMSARLAVINEGEQYLWWSERNGWGQLYRYDADGNLMNKVTDGFFTVDEIEAIDTTRQIVYFEGYGREPGVNPYYSMKYRVNFDGTGMKLLTPEVATHSFSASDTRNYFVDTYSTVADAPKSVLRDSQGNVVLELEQTDLSRLKEAGWKPPQVFSVKAADDATDLYGVMWKPYDFDSTKTYPIISYVYPGPQTEPFPTAFTISGSRAQTGTLAQLGFIVVAFGQRGGSPIRSKYYHDFGYGNLRDYPLPDNKYGIEQLAARYPFIDISRVGIYGHSGGGFMSTAALLTYPDFYDVAVSSSGNHDNNVYNMWWSELHNGVKEKVKKKKKKEEEQEEVTEEGTGGDDGGTVTVEEEDDEEDVTFESSIETNVALAGNLKGHLLLVHGNVDNNVHPANTLRLANALIKAGKRFDMMILPGKRHGYGDEQPYFERVMWHYFAEHLLGDYRDDVDYNLPKDEN